MNYKVGDIIEGQITGIKPYGAFVVLDDKSTGLIHISELSDGFVKDVEHFVTVGQRIRLKVLELDKENSQYRLSLKAVQSTSRKSRPRYQSRPKIKSHDFAPLKERLQAWIDESLKEKRHDKT